MLHIRVQPSSCELEVRRICGQVGQGLSQRPLGRRLGQKFDLRDRRGALAAGGAHAVGPGVAAADDDDVLALGQDLGLRVDGVAGVAAVLLDEELHGEADAVQVAAGDRRGRAARGRRR